MNRLSMPLAFAILLGGSTVLDADEPALAHLVFFTLADDTPEHRQQLVAACKKHLSQHEGTVYFSVGPIADDLTREVNDRDFDVALHLVFANKQTHDKYQSHPRHLEFIKDNKQLWSRVRVFDSYVHSSATGPQEPLTTMDQFLAASITVEFDQLSMQSALAEIQKQFMAKHRVSFPFQITIVGRDLQMEGITRNQRVTEFSHREKSLADVLTALAIQANPITKLKSPSDPNQKLVWVVAPDKKSILISTRSAALARSDELPAVFRPSK